MVIPRSVVPTPRHWTWLTSAMRMLYSGAMCTQKTDLTHSELMIGVMRRKMDRKMKMVRTQSLQMPRFFPTKTTVLLLTDEDEK